MASERVKSRKKRSYVWKFFEEQVSESKSNGRVVLCQIHDCTEKIETADYSTAAMITHLKLKHGIFVNIFKILLQFNSF